MEFEWDPAKDEANQRKHGLSFGEAAFIFEGRVLTQPARRGRDGEARFFSIGLLGERAIAVIHTERNGVIRIISARPAKKKERRLHHGHDPQKAE
ncbi:BrnT family toxin [Maricaulis maris]|uniref:BrnT family toxin n=1 Tax=Maricaulis maris TaxID=74318 RepID=UPI00291F9570|nr:membrane protein [Maricaulis maris]